MGKKKPSARDDENPPQQGGGKSKKKSQVIDDDEYSIGTELSEEPSLPQPEEKQEKPGKKKGKKGNSKSLQAKDNGDDIDEENDDDVPEIVFAGKKKGKSKKSGSGSVFTAAAGFGLLGDEGEVDNDDDEEKSGLTGNGDDDEDEPVVSFTGKKKSSKGNKKGSSSFSAVSFDEIDGEDESKNDKVEDDDDEDIGPITFTGKKKKSSKSLKKAVSFSSTDIPDEDSVSVSESAKGGDDKDEDDVSLVEFTGKKKSSKKKSGSAAAKVSNEDEFGSESVDVVESEKPSANVDNGNISKSEEVVGTSKNKKKNKKKSGRTAQEEEDLDKILAELGEAPPTAKPSAPPKQDDKVQPAPEVGSVPGASGEKEGEEEIVESAAAKKKKKKKEKEKEKKAAAAAAGSSTANETAEVEAETIEPKKNDLKSKAAADKKLPKHVREKQELLARRKEAEEKQRREEEEKLRKEEEERLRLEELERQAEEAKRRKKEKEKEKLLKKKQEGKLLTGKQKEEARRLEAMRRQILNSTGGVTLPAGDSGAPTKKPIYQTKKGKSTSRNYNGAAAVKTDDSNEAKETTADLDSEEPKKVEEVESVQKEDKVELPEAVEEDRVEEDDVEDEWDARSWDDVNLNDKGAFADEEVDSEPEMIVKKEIKTGIPAKNAGATSKTVSKHVAEEIEDRKQAKVVVEDKKKKPDPQHSAVSSKPSDANLRSPICCIMGHVDTGKTKLLDCIRGTNVQEGEAGGITQQIGATYFPAENIRDRTKELKADATLKVPGLLVIDTPGHESFNNLRSRGSGLCDIAILVVDIMHGLEPQTKESLELLKMRNTEFIVALNKVDRLYGWKTCRNAPIRKAMLQQSKDVQNEFNMRLEQIVTQFKEQGLNTALYYKNKEMGETFSIVPTSAISGEGIPDMLLLLVQWTQKTMIEKLTYSDEVQCTVLEVKVIEGHGTTIDVVLVNGVLHEGDQIVVPGMQGPIVTSIRALLTPHPMKELRVKGSYIHHKEIKAAMGIKITAQGLEHAIAGGSLYVVKPDDDLEYIKTAALEDVESVLSRIDRSGEGVCVQASTLGSLEALLEFLKTPAVNIPVSSISIGPVHKKDVMKASVMLEKKREYSTILAFDVKVTPEARELAEELGVKIFIADIIYHLFDQFKAYMENIKEEKKKESADEAVFPCVLKILPNCVFNKKDPIVLGVDILEGILKIGTPICIPSQDFIDIGRIASIENNHKPVDYAKKGQQVAIKIVGSNSEEQQKMFGRHFEMDDELVSHISRRSIDILKSDYRDELSNEEWKLVVKLKILFRIQ
ncbi:eukaryotic translation initiation factor 5B-like isoform X2 [Vicia villosa]|uniref:eukaryotic translation initiation factor 5B-like isoform X2 n=1 Tax=Vicia villosa TaxID=3911 RepID=UPI00273B284D|nr:eukaryotic translation initiation factor 5B-like isoform X2 [Vicia villosa]